MTTIDEAVAEIIATPAPILIVDTCSLLDLFRRRDSPRWHPTANPSDIQVAVDLLHLKSARSDAVHLIVPELVPGEYADHADRIEREFEAWFRLHDENQDWLTETAGCLGLSLPEQSPIREHGLHASCRKLADDLLAKAIVLDRDQACLDRAVTRLIAKRRPSHDRQMKDSMNLEQALELSRRLQAASSPSPRVFISSNTRDFADSPTNSEVHIDLREDFTTAGLEYHTSFRSAVGTLRRRGQLLL